MAPTEVQASNGWTAALDRLDAEIDALLDAVDDPATLEVLAVSRAAPYPPDLGPLPATLAGRARSVLQRLTEAERVLVQERQGIALRDPAAARGPVARYFDQGL
jgi:hypothetical protein